ncbi:rhodanese-like domain-containing protein [Legionella sp. W05-934-2]|jgi:rhodanese-related sulfurtransferase|uniref:rhodanese-like domain-containing protein n=1 Tax=Legionella sp. W05-934-2 TaxID=1198649 RepID=UPI0034629EA0
MQHSKEFIALCEDVKKRIKELNVDEVKQGLKKNRFDYLIDVRDADEFEAGHIPDALHLSKGWCEAKIHHHVNQKDASIVLYCGGGNRSALVADNLQKMGYTQVFSMIGGYKAWVNSDS